MNVFHLLDHDLSISVYKSFVSQFNKNQKKKMKKHAHISYH